MFRNPLPLVLFLSLALTACSAGKSVTNAATANPNIAKSFHVGKGQVGVDDKEHLVISKDALDKEFLLTANYVPQVDMPGFSSTKARIVVFHQTPEALMMLQANQGVNLDLGSPEKVLLAKFPILSSDDTQIAFDFNSGMNALFTISADNGSDFGGTDYDAGDDFTELPIAKSYLEGSHTDSSNHLVVRQVAQLQSGDGSGVIPLEIRYFISPYTKNANFTPMPSLQDFKRFGVFETQPVFTDVGNSVLYYTKWDSTKPIKWAVSANTPPQFKQAVKDGVLYWNKVSGKNLMSVVDAPAGVTAPDSELNIVQWNPDLEAGYAYADSVNDPRTGETLHAQVFFPAAWAFFSKDTLRAVVRRLQTTSAAKESVSKQKRFSLRGLGSGELCHRELSADAVQAAAQGLLTANLTDAQLLKIANDIVRVVIAHEVGHTLGLRHNFAASQQLSYPLKQRDSIITQYLTNQKAPDGITIANSVMDYLLTEEDYMMGDQINNGTIPQYDKNVIDMLYSGVQPKNSDWPVYCTDSGINKYMDCQTFDISKSPIEFGAWYEQQMINRLPATILEAYISAKTPVPGTVIRPVEELAPEELSLRVSVARLLNWRKTFLRQYSKKASLIQVKSQYPVVANFNIDAVTDAEHQYVSDEVTRLGGLSAILATLPADFVDTSSKRLNQLLENQYRQGVGENDINYSFTDDEVKTIESNARMYFQKFYDDFRKAEVDILGAAGIKPATAKGSDDDFKLAQGPLSDQLGIYLNQRAQDIIMATVMDTITADVELPTASTTPGSGDSGDSSDGLKKSTTVAKASAESAAATTTRTVTLPIFKESLDLRLAAAKLTDGTHSRDLVWNVSQRYQMQTALKDVVKGAFGTTYDKLTPETMPTAVARWVLDMQKMIAALK